MTEKTKKWEQKDKDLADRMDAYEKVFIHRKPCKEYKKIGWCPHVEQAIARKFKTEVREQTEIEVGSLVSAVILALISVLFKAYCA